MVDPTLRHTSGYGGGRGHKADVDGNEFCDETGGDEAKHDLT